MISMTECILEDCEPEDTDDTVACKQDLTDENKECLSGDNKNKECGADNTGDTKEANENITQEKDVPKFDNTEWVL